MTAALEAFRLIVELAPGIPWSAEPPTWGAPSGSAPPPTWGTATAEWAPPGSPGSPTWVDVTPDVIAAEGVSCSRGRQSPAGSAQPGSMSLTVRNDGLNLLTASQSSAEADATGLAAYSNCSAGRSTAASLSGSASLLMTASAAGGMSAGTAAPLARVVPGRDYSARADLRPATAARTTRAVIDWLAADGQGSYADSYGDAYDAISSAAGPDASEVPSGWAAATASGTAPPGAALARVRVEIDGCAPGEAHYADCLMLSEGAPATWEAPQLGRWTPGHPGSEARWGTPLRLRRRIRLRAQYPAAGGAVHDIWAGHLADVTPLWEQRAARARIVAADVLARLAQSRMRSAIAAEYLADAPAGYWPCDDTAGLSAATDRTGTVAAPSLSVEQAGAGGAVDFGTAGPGVDSETCASVTSVDASNGKYLLATVVPGPNPAAVSVEAMVTRQATGREMTAVQAMRTALDWGSCQANLQVGIDSSGRPFAQAHGWLEPESRATAASAMSAGPWHHLAATWEIGGALTLYVDGVSAATSAPPGSMPAWDRVAIGGTELDAAMWQGNVAHVAVHSAALPASRVAAHAAAMAGWPGEPASARFLRLPAMAGFDADLVAAAAGASTMCPQPTKGRSAAEVAAEIEAAESGLVAADAQGRARLYPRSARWNAESRLTLDATADLLDSGWELSVTDEGLVNDATVSRPGGAAHRAVDADSVAEHGAAAVSEALYVDTDAQAESAAQWLSHRASQPQPAPPAARLSMARMHAAGKAAAALALDIGSLITVEGLPPAAPGWSADCCVEGVSDEIGAHDWVRSLVLSWAPASAAWTLSDAGTHSALGSTTKVVY